MFELGDNNFIALDEDRGFHLDFPLVSTTYYFRGNVPLSFHAEARAFNAQTCAYTRGTFFPQGFSPLVIWVLRPQSRFSFQGVGMETKIASEGSRQYPMRERPIGKTKIYVTLTINQSCQFRSSKVKARSKSICSRNLTCIDLIRL